MEPNTLNVQGCGFGGVTGPVILGVKLPSRLIVNVEHSQTLRWSGGLSRSCPSFLVSRCTGMVRENGKSHGSDRERVHNVRGEVYC